MLYRHYRTEAEFGQKVNIDNCSPRGTMKSAALMKLPFYNVQWAHMCPPPLMSAHMCPPSTEHHRGHRALRPLVQLVLPPGHSCSCSCYCSCSCSCSCSCASSCSCNTALMLIRQNQFYAEAPELCQPRKGRRMGLRAARWR